MKIKYHDNSVENTSSIKNNVFKNRNPRYYLLVSALILSTSTALASKLPDTVDLETINCKLLSKPQSEAVQYTLRMREPIYNITAAADAPSIQFVARIDNFHPYAKQLLSSPYMMNNDHYYYLDRSNSQIANIAEYATRSDRVPIWHAQRNAQILRIGDVDRPPEWIWIVWASTSIDKLYYSCSTVVRTVLKDDIENQRP